MFETSHFGSIDIKLASPERIKELGRNEVKKPETINYRTQKPEADGLFCEKIFGPMKSWECSCGKYKKIRYKGVTCERCGVEVTKNTVRRERMGHIMLAAPVAHTWYFRGIPSRISLLLDIPPKTLSKVIYFAQYIVVNPGNTSYVKKQTIDEVEYREVMRDPNRGSFDARMGAEAIMDLLKELDIDELAETLEKERKNASGQKKGRIIKRLEVVEAFKNSANKPEWMILTVLPVLPPEIRPMVPLDGGRYATSDLNDLYRRVINRNNRLKKLLNIKAPDIIVRNEKRMLQEAVDALIDNSKKSSRGVTGSTSATNNRQLKSLTDMLKGKQGRFRQNLLGKRVDYSGRSVIVVGPTLKMHQCGLPKEMALELFKPFVIKKLVEKGLTQNIKTGRRMVDRANAQVWDILEDVIKDHPVMLNRAPTLHRLGIQAFEPVLVEGRAIKLHPLVCTAFNADFDGDQMAVHVPLSAEAQAEARFLMLSSNNLLKPQDGNPVTVPTQDMILGCYYLTICRPGAKGEGMVFSSIDEAFMAYDEHQIELHSKVRIRITRMVNGVETTGLVESSFGRFIFNDIIPQDLGYVDRSIEGNELLLECDFVVGKKQLGKIISRSIAVHGSASTAALLDNIKELGYKYSTRGGISIGIEDMIVPDVKEKMIKEAEAKVELINNKFDKGFLNENGRYKAVIKIWETTTEAITKALIDNLGEYNPIKMMADSGARGSAQQIKQLAGMRGNMADTSGKTIEIPIKSNLREGMNVLEFFISSHGARKALSDTALKTADSGYLTRRLVDVAQEVIISEEDCGTEDFTWVKEIAIKANGKKDIVKTLADRLTGRYAAEQVVDPETNKVLIEKNQLIDAITAGKIEDAGFKKVKIRSVFDCKSRHGVCSKCYGLNLATGLPTTGGEAVGIMAAQSIGEPGTQLTMRTFHTGGIATGEDITQGLPRVEELFEARKPKGEAIISAIDGVVHIEEGAKGKREIIVTAAANSEFKDDDGKAITECRYPVPLAATLKVSDGDTVEAADMLTDGTVNPSEIMKIKGERGVQKYIVSEVLKVYKSGGVTINDKHIEVITRQMMRRVRIDDPGTTSFVSGTTVDMFDFEAAVEELKKEMDRLPEINAQIAEENEKIAEENAKIMEENASLPEGKQKKLLPLKEEKTVILPSGKRQLLGITKASLATDSFLSAASFQETAKVLTDAAVKGKKDPLIGLKENVIIGSLIPAGTGVARYRNITAVPVIKENCEIITGHAYGDEPSEEDQEQFANEFYEDLVAKEKLEEEQDA
ncbi:MAG: DNA-directed RNA polymerase subunit beta' [Clostridia bacterium]|nr:DNA-directed RNA polymerase subunit beta' [Clostridia bacterium]